ncbi:MAG: hypothetical protein HIU82_13955 [Proteobacteria bacterium]|nr:hypothetical protein [Pseudomonadota bacterium]
MPGQRWYYFWCKIVGPDATGSVWVDASLPVRNAAFQAALIRAARDRAERVALGDAFDDYDFPSVNPIAGAPSPPPVWWRRISARLALDLVWAGTLLWVFATKGARV